MKRLFAILLSVIMLLSFCSCFKLPQKYQGTLDLSYITEADINYDSYAHGATLFTAEDVCVYTDYDSKNDYFCLYNNGSRIALFKLSSIHGDSFDYSNYFILNNRLYFATDVYDEATYVSTKVFYEFDFTSQKINDVHAANHVWSWLATENGIVYLTDGEQESSSLYLFDFNSEKEKYIADGVYDYSVINGKVRYVVYENEYVLYEYDTQSSTSFELARISDYNSRTSLEFRFTKDKLIYLDFDDFYFCENPSFFILDIESKQIAEHKVVGIPESFSVSEKYAFILTSDNTNLFKIKCSLYQIDLQTETVTDLKYKHCDNIYSIQAESDSTLYFDEYVDNPFSDDTSSIVKYDVPTQKAEYLFKY